MRRRRAPHRVGSRPENPRARATANDFYMPQLRIQGISIGHGGRGTGCEAGAWQAPVDQEARSEST
eukprot:6860048-Pyramimonas_sp.AAC.1